jgi:hypothetical protein
MGAFSTPGFTAEAALSAHSTRYVTNSRAKSSRAVVIEPQIRRNPDSGCIEGCVCVSPDGCPCCYSLGWPYPLPPISADLVQNIIGQRKNGAAKRRLK